MDTAQLITPDPATAETSGATGRAYGLRVGTPDEDLVRCGPGTLGGELLRRYWQPIAASSDIKDLPREIRVLGENLILYRDKQGKPGLLYPRCVHRGTSLLYAKVENNGLRCCYHGWLFDQEGRCLEMPCEPDARIMRNVRQPWYPLVEKFGLIFTYMGPAELQPEFPSFNLEDDLADDEEIIGMGSMDETPPAVWVILGRHDYNWWQSYDNMVDPYHVFVLHAMINGMQFVPDLAILPTVQFEPLPDGLLIVSHRDIGGGRVHQRVSQCVLPNMSTVSAVTDELGPSALLGWHVPRDDTSHRYFSIHRVKKSDAPGGHAFSTNEEIKKIPLFSGEWGPGKPADQWTLEDWQRWQCDYIAQKSQGPITLHSEEHLSQPDRGVALMRRAFKQAARAVAEGKNPPGSAPGEAYRVVTSSGNAILAAGTLECVKGFDGRH